MLLLCAAYVYPSWQQRNTQRLFGYDSMGYYLYLPATFIHHDLQHYRFLEQVVPLYNIWDCAYQPELLANGNKLNKYAVGLAMIELPGFALGHVAAQVLGYAPDGFSPPYHTAVSLWNIGLCLLSLCLLRRLLLRYFTDAAVAISLLLLVLATNYWCYVSYNVSLVHAPLFALLVLLWYCTERWYAQPTYPFAIAIGALVGIITAARPTDIVVVLLPLLWGLYSASAIQTRWQLWAKHAGQLAAAVWVGGAIISVQLVYWHYITGSWVYYSYNEQGFDFLHPHVTNVLYSYKKGWLLYTPIMLAALIGFIPLYRQHRSIFWAVLGVFATHFYLVSSWAIWWYGGSYGQRALIEAYAVLMFPFAAFWQMVWSSRWYVRALAACVALPMAYLNFTQTFGSVVEAEGETKTYYWATFGSMYPPREHRKYLEVDERRTEQHCTEQLLYEQNFETDTAANTTTDPPRPSAPTAGMAQR